MMPVGGISGWVGGVGGARRAKAQKTLRTISHAGVTSLQRGAADSGKHASSVVGGDTRTLGPRTTSEERGFGGEWRQARRRG